ncbi:MAG: hypothetical protein ACI90V_012288, partial [Bacillariaceae sp.]
MFKSRCGEQSVRATVRCATRGDGQIHHHCSFIFTRASCLCSKLVNHGILCEIEFKVRQGNVIMCITTKTSDHRQERQPEHIQIDGDR